MNALVRLDLWCDPSTLDLARPVADMLRAAGTDPQLRMGAEATGSPDGILVLLSSSPISPCWVDETWIAQVLTPARANGTPVFPVLLDNCTPPEALSHLSFADFVHRDRTAEELRLLISLAEHFGADRINVPKLASDIPTSPPRHPIRLRHGAGLAPLMDHRFKQEALPIMRDGLFHELGVPFPEIHVERDDRLPAMGFAIDLFDVEEVAEIIPTGKIFVNAHPDDLTDAGYLSQPATNPANGHLYAWIDESHAKRVMAQALTIWDMAGWMVLRLSALLRSRASTFLDQRIVGAMLDRLRPHFPRLVDTTVPGALPLADLTDILRRLVAEGIPVRDLRRILIELAEIAAYETHTDTMTECLRTALKHKITHLFSRGQGHLVVILIDPAFEDRMIHGLTWGKTASWIALEPQEVAALLDNLEDLIAGFGPGIQAPLILTRQALRAAVRRLIAQRFPTVQVICYNEVESSANIQPLGRIGPAMIERRPNARATRPVLQ